MGEEVESCEGVEALVLTAEREESGAEETIRRWACVYFILILI